MMVHPLTNLQEKSRLKKDLFLKSLGQSQFLREVAKWTFMGSDSPRL